MKPTLPYYILLACCLTYSAVNAQVIVFSDDFSEYTDPTWTTSGNLSGSAWDVYRSGVDFGARRNDSPVQLEVSNDISGGANVAGWAFASTTTSLFSAPYNTTLSNGGVVTWTFNMRQIRVDPAGFDATNYGVAFILAGETATTNSLGNGYAVVLGQSGSIDPIRLVRYTTGITGNSGLTNIIVSNTAGLSDFGLEHLSIQVTYNPCAGGVWELFLRNDGTAFQDPLSGTLVSQGTAIDNTYTGGALDMMAAYWQGSTTANQPAFFNNVSVSVVATPDATIGSNPIICSGTTSADLTYSGLTGDADQYNIDWDAAAESEGFSDVTGMTLLASPIILSIPGGAAPAIYNGTLTLLNSTTMCESDPYPITVTINALPTVGCPNDTTLCSNEPAYSLAGGTPLGGTYTGTGVSGGTFDPAMANAGINIITYTYTDVNLCSNTCTFDITINTAPVADAGTYGPACYDDPDILLMGMPVGGTWSGPGVTGDMFDPSFGTETLTYTYTDGNGCTDSDQTTITVNSCADPSTMRWALLEEGEQHGSCTSNSDCEQNIICFGLEYTPLFTGVLTSYTTGFFMDCNNGIDPVVSNVSCIMTDNSQTLDFCVQVDSILFNSSGNSGTIQMTAGVSYIIHQVCFSVPTGEDMIITKDNTLGLSASFDLTGGGFDTDNIQNYTPYVVNGDECEILPLTWLDFSAKANGELVSKLEWSTANEVNNSHFEIQRSYGENFAFQTIGRVDADDVVRNVHSYTFTDANARPGKNYYRLRQVDYDGRFDYSPIRVVSFANTTFGVDVWPNPARELITVYIRQASSDGQISMVDLSGRIVHTQVTDAGVENHEINAEQFTPGVYTMIVTSGENQHVQKIVIVK